MAPRCSDAFPVPFASLSCSLGCTPGLHLMVRLHGYVWQIKCPTTKVVCTIQVVWVQIWGVCYDSFRAGPDPIPAPAWPRTDPRRFIGRAPCRVASHHVTPSRRAPPHDTRDRIGRAAHRGPCGFSYLPYRPPYCIKGPVEPRSKISLVIEYHRRVTLPTPHS